MRLVYSAVMGSLFSIMATNYAYAQLNGEQLYNLQNRSFSPFGYGKVLQFLTQSTGQTGNQLCKINYGANAQCVEASGGNSCAVNLSPGTLVSCNSASTPAVSNAYFQPVNCNGNANGDGNVSGKLNGDDWCLQSNVEPNKLVDTLYHFNDYVRIGVNQRFGGTIYELYGVDGINRIMQNGGGAMQLSLWGDDAGYSPSSASVAYFAVNNTPDWWKMPSPGGWDKTAYQTYAACKANHPNDDCQAGYNGPNVSNGTTEVACAANGFTLGGPYNPIQAISSLCNWGDSSAYVDNLYSAYTNMFSVRKKNPYNYTKTSSVQGLTWTQTTQIQGPFAQITYDIFYDGPAMNADFQEIPAIFLHDGIGDLVYYDKAPNPYSNVNAPVYRASVPMNGANLFQMPNRPGPFGTGAQTNLTEEWASTCDATEKKCVTIASFSDASQDIVFEHGQSSYIGIHGFFALTPGMRRRVTVWIAPYRFDDVVQGRSVRQWVYDLRNTPVYPGAIN